MFSTFNCVHYFEPLFLGAIQINALVLLHFIGLHPLTLPYFLGFPNLGMII
jgi:hypothetical protein